MNKIRVMIVDDEPLARSGLRRMLTKDEELAVVAEAPDGRAALAVFKDQRPDLIFLDVQMPGMSGIQFLEQLPAGPRPIVIFTTAFDEYAIKAFDLHAVDYLLKPFSNRRFSAAVDRAKARHRVRHPAQINRQFDELMDYFRQQDARVATPPPTGLPDRIVVKADGALHFIEHADVVWIEGQGDYLKIHAGKNSVLIRDTLAGLAARLDATRFVRVHKSAIVNVEHVRKLKAIHYGDHALETSDGSAIRVGRAYRDKVASLITARH
ncbi:MAG: LytTR family DNA-binding domain-containing protein [bacterium]|nr:LytTR family DNA-binding domain-containing protein [bacterium]MDI1337390.1 LytTR family DNA-binding domain-containing protein [Lacunisphaera sp.]